jgi:hypothetical protein
VWEACITDTRGPRLRERIWAAGFGSFAIALFSTYLASEALEICRRHFDPRRCRVDKSNHQSDLM